MADARGRRPLVLFLATLLLLGTGWIYAHVGTFEFVNYDDDRYVTANPMVQRGLDAESVRWALSATAASNWHPVTWLSHLVDVSLFDLDAGAHHRTSVLLHALNALLFLALVLRWTGAPWVAFGAAAVYAWSPLRVESVAWVAERKDLLSVLFALLSLWSYTTWARARRPLALAGAVLAFALALASKPTLVTLPFVLLLLDAWPLERREPLARRLLEKLPLFALSLGSAVLTYRVQDASGATAMTAQLGPLLRIENALAAVASYAAGFVKPAASACLVLHPALRPAGADGSLHLRAFLGALLVAAALLLVWRNRRRLGPASVAVLWSLGALVPMLGLVQVGYQARADRYTYWPFLGLALGSAVLVGRLAARLGAGRWLLRGAVALFLAVQLLEARVATEPWHDSTALWTHALGRDADNFVAENNLGTLAARAGDDEAALAHLERSVALHPGTAPDPDSAARWMNLGQVRERLGRTKAAIDALRTAVSLAPRSPAPHDALAAALARQGLDAGASRQWERSLTLAPEDLAATIGLADLLATSRDDTLRDGERARALALGACQRTGYGEPRALAALAAAQAELGNFVQARRLQEKVLAPYRSSPTAPDAFEHEMLQRMDAYTAGNAWRKTP